MTERQKYARNVTQFGTTRKNFAIIAVINFMEKIKMFRARKSAFNDSWLVEQEIPCINGLSAWFEIAVCHQTSEAEMGYTDGKHGTARDRAVFIVAALNDVEAGF